MATGAHPRPSLARRIGVSLLVTVVVALVFEVLLRFVVTYNIDYYTIRTDPGVHELPYGTVRINSHGFPDEEWDLDDPRPRVGYLGDSVVFGTGAGYGYRFPDLIGEARPAAQHLTIASSQSGIQGPKRLVEFAERFELDSIVYAMNLNDVMASRGGGGGGKATPAARPRRSAMEIAFGMARKLDGLRGVSYLYNYSRARARNMLRRHGYVATGKKDVEFYPEASSPLIRDTAERINRAAALLRDHGVELCVLLLPYEMQISEEAATRYRELGINWEPSFLDRGTQAKLLEHLDPSIERVDAFYAFVDPESPEADRAANGLGEYFVYNRGDKIDYNHPTRIGHRRIADYALAEGFCQPREGSAAATLADAGPAR